MKPSELEVYLHTHIPLTRAMQVSVLSIEPAQLILQAPLAPNINPHHTVFGGSVATLATLAAWCLLHTRLEAEGLANSLVVRRSTLDYDKPIAGDFQAIASLETPEQWEQAVKMFQQRGKAKLAVLSVLEYQQQITGRFRGEFVALKA
ncbi:YiiD C-terminal domain-containing protein [uncultured Thiothrix sp.]|uniref:YiiD C-terminal domain-containing protein n=1 Tax=uncultured Thiothrix sp. TaxID=223185 RepID=UPI0026074011|nr:YiiD C-terminal domain-containing protein [uncultured Thiothrix sp.]